MSITRSFVRLAFAGLFVNFVAVACVVSDGNEDDDDVTNCDPGAYKDCTCADGDAGTKKCNVSGSGYAACDCTAAGVGGGANGGEGGGATAAGSAGEANTPGGAGGIGGNAAGGASEGGAGGADPGLDACVLDETDDCQSCVQIDCCTAWQACADETEGDCEQEVLNIMACAQVDRDVREVVPADIQACGEAEGGGDVWSEGILPTTKAVIDCVAGGQGWGAKDDLADSSCHSLCFNAL